MVVASLFPTYDLLSEGDVTCTIMFLFILGFFMEPTIFTNVEDHMFVAKEESFGPVMVISIFENG